LEFLERKKHKIIGGGGKLEFLGIFQKTNFFEKIVNFFQNHKLSFLEG